MVVLISLRTVRVISVSQLGGVKFLLVNCRKQLGGDKLNTTKGHDFSLPPQDLTTAQYFCMSTLGRRRWTFNTPRFQMRTGGEE